jgi:hypothetical protein
MSSTRAPSSSANSARARSLSVKKSWALIRQGRHFRAMARPRPRRPASRAATCRRSSDTQRLRADRTGGAGTGSVRASADGWWDPRVSRAPAPDQRVQREGAGCTMRRFRAPAQAAPALIVERTPSVRFHLWTAPLWPSRDRQRWRARRLTRLRHRPLPGGPHIPELPRAIGLRLNLGVKCLIVPCG